MTNDIPNNLLEQFKVDQEAYIQHQLWLKDRAKIAKRKLLSTDFELPYIGEDLDKRINFINQFPEFISHLALFPDDEILIKLKKLKFKNSVLKWFIPLNDLVNEINRLQNIEGVFFLSNTYLAAARFHLETKILVNLLEDFGADTLYNNTETNIVFKDFADRDRKLKYFNKKGEVPKLKPFDKVMMILQNFGERITTEKNLIRKYNLKTTKGDTSIYYTLLDGFNCVGISERSFYLKLFPLLKLLLKEHDLFSEEKYEIENTDYTHQNYIQYKISRVKKILTKR